MIKNPDLIDEYLNLFLTTITLCAWVTISTLSTVVLWSYILVNIDFDYSLFTIFDLAALVVVGMIWCYLLFFMVCFVYDVAHAYRSFMES